MSAVRLEEAASAIPSRARSLTDFEARDKNYKVSDRDELYAYGAPSNAVSLRYDFRIGKRRETLTLGRYDASPRPLDVLDIGMGLSLVEARRLLIKAKRSLEPGVSPSRAKAVHDLRPTFSASLNRAKSCRTPYGALRRLGYAHIATLRALVLSAIVTSVKYAQRLRARLIGILSMALLFSQIAVAAYACPAMREGTERVSSDMAAMAGMPCAEMMAAGVALDPEQPTLCIQHCQFGSTPQVVDHVPPVFAPVTDFPALFTVRVDERLDLGLSHWAEDERLRDRPPPIAHSIAHCCYRI